MNWERVNIMMEISFKSKLRHSLHSHATSINDSHLSQTILLASRELSDKPHHERINFRSFLILQIRFIGWKIWLLQGFLLTALCFMLTAAFGNELYHNPKYAALFLCSISILVLMMSIPFIQRALRYKMREVEMASYFSSVRLLMVKLFIIGIGDIFILGGALFITVSKTPLNISAALLYLIFPSLLTGCGYLYLLGHIPAQWFSSCCTMLCSMLYICIVLLNRFMPEFFRQELSGGWAAACVILLILCVSQFRYVVCCSAYAKVQLY